MLHGGDIVEETLTYRQGEIDAIKQYISGDQKMASRRWRMWVSLTARNHSSNTS
jgi:hypothetical protein